MLVPGWRTRWTIWRNTIPFFRVIPIGGNDADGRTHIPRSIRSHRKDNHYVLHLRGKRHGAQRGRHPASVPFGDCSRWGGDASVSAATGPTQTGCPIMQTVYSFDANHRFEPSASRICLVCFRPVISSIINMNVIQSKYSDRQLNLISYKIV